MTSPRLLLAAGSVAASLVGIAPLGLQGSAAASAPIRVDAAGISVSAGRVAAKGNHATLVVPQGVTRLAGSASGSPAVASRTRLTIVRSSDGATIFTGSLATFRSLPVSAGATLVVSVQRSADMAGLKAVAMLRWF